MYAHVQLVIGWHEKCIECVYVRTMYYFYRMAFTALQNIVSNYPDWRTDILKGYAIFILQEIPDSCPLVLEGSLKSLGQLLGHWRGLVTTGGQEEMDLSNPPGNAIE